MRTAVKLHREAKFKAVEIDEILSDWKLAPKLEPCAAVAQEVPRESFRCRFVTSQLTGFRSFNFHENVPPHPHVQNVGPPAALSAAPKQSAGPPPSPLGEG